MINNISIDGLEKLGIYELRNVARQIGVYSPTLYKKDELISKIMAIVSGEEQPYVKKTNQGRPPKQIAGLEDILNIFVPEIKSNNEILPKLPSEQIFTLSKINEVEVVPDNVAEFSGMVKLEPGYAIIFKNGFFENNENTFYVAPKLFNQLNLKDCDFVKGLYYKSNVNEPQMVYTINTINGLNTATVMNNIRGDFDKLNAVYPTNIINLNVQNRQLVDFYLIDKICPIGKGSRVKINYDKHFDIDSFIINMVSSISLNNNISTTIIAVNERPEDISFIKDECDFVTILNNNGNTSDENYAKFLFNKIENIVRQVELNKNHAIIIKNLDKFKSFLINYFIINNSCDENSAKVFAEQKLKSILMLAKNTKENKALTIISLNANDNNLDELFNNNIYLKNFMLDDSDVHLDVYNSYSLKTNLILKNEDNNKLIKFKEQLKTQDLKQTLLDFIE